MSTYTAFVELAFERLNKELAIPKGFAVALYKEEDSWSFISKLAQLVEGTELLGEFFTQANDIFGEVAFVELVPGTPALRPDGSRVMCADRGGARRLLVGGEPVTPEWLQVRSIVGLAGRAVTFLANPIDDATVQHVWQWTPDGLRCLSEGDGMHSGSAGGPDHSVVVIRSASLQSPTARTTSSTARTAISSSAASS